MSGNELIFVVAAVAGYLAGSIPFGLLLTRVFGAGDLRQVGSGNIGATNVLRTGRKGLAAATLLLDAGKGAAAALLAAQWGENPGLIAGLFAVLGHNFPVWLGFKGGKGVASTLGVIIAVAWPAGILACVTWLIVAFAMRISSLAALVALALAPVYAWYLDGPNQATLALVLAVLGFARHHANISRLLKGTEPRIGAGK